jgi:hypothetical protein
MQNLAHDPSCLPLFSHPFGVTYEKTPGYPTIG